MSRRRVNSHTPGIGYIKGSMKKKIPYKRFLKRDSISRQEYKRFRKIYLYLELAENKIRHKKSVVEIILRKYNKIGCHHI